MIPTPTFFVAGEPEGQGNHRIGKRGKFARIYDANVNLESWRDCVARAAIANGWKGRELLDGPVALSVAFIIKRPESHFGVKGLLKNKPQLPHTAGDDIDKLLRAICDSLTGIVYRDDRRVVTSPTCRVWGPREGALISVKPFVWDDIGSGLLDLSLSDDLDGDAALARRLWPSGTFAEAWARAAKYDTVTKKSVKGAA